MSENVFISKWWVKLPLQVGLLRVDLGPTQILRGPKLN